MMNFRAKIRFFLFKDSKIQRFQDSRIDFVDGASPFKDSKIQGFQCSMFQWFSPKVKMSQHQIWVEYLGCFSETFGVVVHTRIFLVQKLKRKDTGFGNMALRFCSLKMRLFNERGEIGDERRGKRGESGEKIDGKKSEL
jgi:hypothetical protein